MQLNRIYAILLRQYYLMRGSITRLVPLFVWVAIDIVLWGFITRYLNTLSMAGTNFVPAFLGAILLWDFLVRVMQGTTMAFMEDIWSRNFLGMFASPLKVSEYLCGLVVTSISTSVLALIVMLVLATSLFGLSLFAYGIVIVPALLILFLFGIALGIIGCAIMLRLGPAAEWFIWPIPALISPFACVFYPLHVLPQMMQWIAHLLPPMYVFETLRAAVAGGHAEPQMLAEGACLAVLYIVLACVVYAYVHKGAVRTGLIARYSAESVA